MWVKTPLSLKDPNHFYLILQIRCIGGVLQFVQCMYSRLLYIFSHFLYIFSIFSLYSGVSEESYSFPYTCSVCSRGCHRDVISVFSLIFSIFFLYFLYIFSPFSLYFLHSGVSEESYSFPYTCSVCTRGFQTTKGLIRHAENHHPDQGMY